MCQQVQPRMLSLGVNNYAAADMPTRRVVTLVHLGPAHTLAPQPSPADSSLKQTNSIKNFHNPVSEIRPGNYTSQEPSVDGSSGNMWKHVFVVPGVALLLIVAAVMLCMCRRRGVTTIGPWMTDQRTVAESTCYKSVMAGCMREFQQCYRTELEAACEDFSNTIDFLDDCTADMKICHAWLF